MLIKQILFNFNKMSNYVSNNTFKNGLKGIVCIKLDDIVDLI